METSKIAFFDTAQVPAQAFAYASAGLVGTAAHYALMIALLQGGFGHVVLASTLGAVTGGLINYLLAHGKVFRSQVQHHIALPKFAFVAIVGICMNAAVLGVSAPLFGVLGGQVLASATALICGFVLNRTWSFRA